MSAGRAERCRTCEITTFGTFKLSSHKGIGRFCRTCRTLAGNSMHTRRARARTHAGTHARGEMTVYRITFGTFGKNAVTPCEMNP